MAKEASNLSWCNAQSSAVQLDLSDLNAYAIQQARNGSIF